MNQMSKIQTNEVAKSKYERVLKRSTSTAVLVLFAQGLSGCFRNDGSIDGPSISGVAFDGPLSRAKVFVDANNNNLLDGSEDWTWTNLMVHLHSLRMQPGHWLLSGPVKRRMLHLVQVDGLI